MAKYMVVWDLSPENRNDAIERFVEGSALQEPEGVKLVSRWHAAVGGVGWSVVEADDPKALTGWLLKWSDLLSYEAIPIIDDQEFGEMLAANGMA